MRHGVRVFLSGLLLAILASCGMWIGRPAVDMPDSGVWTVLPMREFVSRPSIDVVGMQLCTVAKCGYAAAVERFNAWGEHADELQKQLALPRELARLIGKTNPGSKRPPSKVSVENFTSGKWSGVRVAMSGGTRGHQVHGYVVSQRIPSGASFIVVIAADAAIASRLLAVATR